MVPRALQAGFRATNLPKAHAEASLERLRRKVPILDRHGRIRASFGSDESMFRRRRSRRLGQVRAPVNVRTQAHATKWHDAHLWWRLCHFCPCPIVLGQRKRLVCAQLIKDIGCAQLIKDREAREKARKNLTRA